MLILKGREEIWSGGCAWGFLFVPLFRVKRFFNDFFWGQALHFGLFANVLYPFFRDIWNQPLILFDKLNIIKPFGKFFEIFFKFWILNVYQTVVWILVTRLALWSRNSFLLITLAIWRILIVIISLFFLLELLLLQFLIFSLLSLLLIPLFHFLIFLNNLLLLLLLSSLFNSFHIRIIFISKFIIIFFIVLFQLGWNIVHLNL